MKKNQVYRVNINDYSYLDILFNGTQLRILSYGNCPKENVEIIDTRDRSIISVNGVQKVAVNKNSGRMMTRLKFIPMAAIRNFSELLKDSENTELLNNQVEYNRKKDLMGYHNKTELHTHFMEILDGERFLSIIMKYTNCIYIDKDGKLPEVCKTVKGSPKVLDTSSFHSYILVKDLLKDNNLFNEIASQLSIPIDKQVPFSEIHHTLKRRTALLQLAGYSSSLKEIQELEAPSNKLDGEINHIISDAKADIYVDILIESLELLKEQGIKYVEMSFSTPSTIIKIHERLKNYKIEGIRFNFLLSENRDNDASYFREYYKDKKTGNNKRNKDAVECTLVELINKGYITGFDLMGFEREITPSDYIKNAINNDSLYDRLEPVLIQLNKFNDDKIVCRLHAGEIGYEEPLNNDSKSNPERTLEIVDKIAKDNDLTIPPPSIRIGHGLHINKNNRYLDLLRKYKVIIEINASSNFALSNIQDMKKIPYKWYLENGIPVVLGTDGGGFYLTTPLDESKIAELFAGSNVAKTINAVDSHELKKRGY